MTKRKTDQNKKGSTVKTFTVPFAEKKIKEYIINKDSVKLSKEEIIKNAVRFHSQSNFIEAAKYYQQFIDQGFKDHRVFSNYGVVLIKLGNLIEAEISTRKAIELNPDFANAHYNLGNILKDLGKLQEAELSYQKAIKLNPDLAQAQYNLGSILIELGKLKEAEVATRRAIEIKPNYAYAHYNMGKILADLGKLEQAESSFRKSIKLKFGFVQAHDELASILEKSGRKQEAEDSSKKVLYLKSIYDLKFESEKRKHNNLFNRPSQIEYPNMYRPGMGTENVGAFLRSMAMMLRPKRILEIGSGYTTPFLLEALINNERVFDDGNLNESYFENYTYDAKLVIIDNQSLGELTKVPGMEEIINSKYTDFVEGDFEEKGEELFKKYGHFDFVWFDCGGQKEYKSFIQEYWKYCSNYIFFHFTYSDGKPNIFHKIIHDKIENNQVIIDIVEPHKKRQGSVTMVKKENFKI